MFDLNLEDIGDLQYVKNVPFPASVKYRQLIITGPPGSGKSRLIRQIGGWPEEGYIDLTFNVFAATKPQKSVRFRRSQHQWAKDRGTGVKKN